MLSAALHMLEISRLLYTPRIYSSHLQFRLDLSIFPLFLEEVRTGEIHVTGGIAIGAAEDRHLQDTDAESVDLHLGETAVTPMFGRASVAEGVLIPIAAKHGTLLDHLVDAQSQVTVSHQGVRNHQEHLNIALNHQEHLNIDLNHQKLPSIDLSQRDQLHMLNLQGLPLPDQPTTMVVDLESLWTNL